jgi:hypothetical protein
MQADENKAPYFRRPPGPMKLPRRAPIIRRPSGNQRK